MKKVSKENETNLTVLSARMEAGFKTLNTGLKTLHEGQEQIKEDITTLKQKMGNVENKLEDISDTLNGVERAVDKDAVTTIGHERRITRLEKSHA